MGAIFELDIPAYDKLVLLAMADHARDDGTGCYPSIDTLARKSSLSRRGVQGIMRRLEDSGLIAPEKISRGRRSTEYRITLANRAPGSLFPVAQPRTAAHPTANPVPSTAHLTASNRAPGSPESLRTLDEPLGNPRAAVPRGDPRHQPFVEFATEAYAARFGQSPTWGRKDYKNLAELLRRARSIALEELQRRFTAYLGTSDLFIVRNGYGLSTFCMRFDALRDGPIPQHGRGKNGNGGLDANERTRSNLAAAGLQPI